MTLALGCIADDFTGATDLGNNFTLAGLSVEQFIGVPAPGTTTEAQVAIIALKSRTSPTQEAVAQSLAALAWLQTAGARQIYFKVCSTFDSWFRPERFGNIGPVTEALMAALGAPFALVTPAFPRNKRTVFNGYLFIGEALLQDTSMRHHPLTPMDDSSLVRIMQGQSAGKVGLISYDIVRQGPKAIRARCEALSAQGFRIGVIDALTDDDLLAIGEVAQDLPLLTAASGLAVGMAPWLRGANQGGPSRFPLKRGLCAVISGSCSAATLGQLRHAAMQGVPIFQFSMADWLAGAQTPDVLAAKAIAWAAPAMQQTQGQPLVIASSADTTQVRALQDHIGQLESAALIDEVLSQVARGLMDLGVRQLVIAGGETSGACVKALGIDRLQIGPQIDVGVPWCFGRSATRQDGLHLALKSGNFGDEDFFTAAFHRLA
jgi:uncharacterized protein YgbK (DUF1537 family)